MEWLESGVVVSRLRFEPAIGEERVGIVEIACISGYGPGVHGDFGLFFFGQSTMSADDQESSTGRSGTRRFRHINVVFFLLLLLLFFCFFISIAEKDLRL